MLDQIAHGRSPIADHGGGFPNGGGDDAIVDDDDAEIGAFHELLDHHLVAELARGVDRGLGVVPALEADGDAFALLAARRLHHHRLMPLHEGARAGLVVGRHLLGHPDIRRFDDAAGHALVVANAHGDCRRQRREALAANDGAPAIGQAEEAALRVDDVDADAAPPRLVDDDQGVRIERLIVERRLGEQPLVDDVLALDGERGPAE